LHKEKEEGAYRVMAPKDHLKEQNLDPAIAQAYRDFVKARFQFASLVLAHGIELLDNVIQIQLFEISCVKLRVDPEHEIALVALNAPGSRGVALNTTNGG
jgi:hypothetical protein